MGKKSPLILLAFLLSAVNAFAWMDAWAPDFNPPPAPVREMSWTCVSNFAVAVHWCDRDSYWTSCHGGLLDLNGDGVEDQVFILPWMGCGLGNHLYSAYFFVSSKKDGWTATRIDGYGMSMSDLVSVRGKVYFRHSHIACGFEKSQHNHWVYQIFSFDAKGDMVCANSDFERLFPAVTIYYEKPKFKQIDLTANDRKIIRDGQLPGVRGGQPISYRGSYWNRPRAYEMDADTAKLKRQFEAEWKRQVGDCTNGLTVTMTGGDAGCRTFFKEWQRRILRHQAYKIEDSRLRERVLDWMLKAKSVESLYHGLLVPHQEIIDRWYAYEMNKDAQSRENRFGGGFKNGRARWKDEKGREMSAVMLLDYIWPRRWMNAFAIIQVGESRFFDKHGSCLDDAATEFWVGVLCQDLLPGQGELLWAKKIPSTGVCMSSPSVKVPFGCRYTIAFERGKAKVLDCRTGTVVLELEDYWPDEDWKQGEGSFNEKCLGGLALSWI